MVRGIPKTGKNETVDFLRTPMGVQHAQPMHLPSQGRPTIRRKEPAKRNQNESTPGKAQKTAKAAQNEAQGLISKQADLEKPLATTANPDPPKAKS